MNQRRNGRQLIFIGVGVVVLGLLGYLFLHSMGGGSSKAAAPSTSGVVVALQPIAQGTTFTSGESLAPYFAVHQVPKNLVPFGAYTNVHQIASLINTTGCQPISNVGCSGNLTTMQTLYQNLPVVSGMFSTLGEFRTSAGPAFQIPYGYVAIAVSLTDSNSVLGSIQPGDDVDLMASLTGWENDQKSKIPKQTQYVLNDIRVIGVNGPPAPPEVPGSGAPKTATSASGTTATGGLVLLVRYQQALIIQHLKDFGGSWTMSVVLRSSKETDIPHFKTLPVTANWFFVKQSDHFDMTNPY